jgi:hypothetical protein
VPTTLEALIVLIGFITPGFIAFGVVRRSAPGQALAGHGVIVASVVLGVVVHLVALPLTILVTPELLDFRGAANLSQLALPSAKGAGWAIAVLLLLPILLGLLIGKVLRAGWAQRFLAEIGYSVVQLTPQAWDWFFATNRQGCWIVAEMNDGSRIGGLFNRQSFASLSPDRPDLYLEQVYAVDEAHNFGDVRPHSVGAWINGSAVKALFFYRVESGSAANG